MNDEWILEYRFRAADGEMYWDVIKTGPWEKIMEAHGVLVEIFGEADRVRMSRLAVEGVA